MTSSQNGTIKCLGLSQTASDLQWHADFDMSDSTTVFENLWKFQGLEELRITGTFLPKLSFSTIAKNPVTALKRLRLDDIAWEGSCKDHMSSLLEVVKTHPQLLEIYGGDDWKETCLGPEIHFLLDLRNILPKTRCALPLSLWPRVLERTNRILPDEDRQASMIYYLIRDRAFETLPINGEVTRDKLRQSFLRRLLKHLGA
jgi:hypothetical protein